MKIKFLPQNVEVEGDPNKTLLQIATENKLEIRSICKGVPSCAECRVRIVDGSSNTLPPSKPELNLIGTSYYIDGRRLSCQVHCFGDITVDLSEQVERIENQSKKIRGFRANKQVESRAVNDTMLLTEKPEEGKAQERSEPSPAQPGQDAGQVQHQSRNQNQQRQQGKKQGGQPQQRKKQKQGGGKPQQNQNRQNHPKKNS